MGSRGRLRARILKLCVLLALSSYGRFAHAGPYDKCEQVLLGGKFNTSISYSAVDTHTSLKLWMCAQGERTSENADQFDIAAAHSGAFASAAYSKERFSSWKAATCSSLDFASGASERAYYYRQAVDPRTIEAWEKCMTDANNGFICWATPVDDSRFVLAVKISPGPWNGYRDIKTVIDGGKPTQPVTPTIAERQEQNVLVRRNQPDSAVVALVSGTATGGEKVASQCAVVVPPLRKSATLKPGASRIATGPNITWQYVLAFTEPLTLRSGVVEIAGLSLDISARVAGAVGAAFTGEVQLRLMSEAMTEDERQAWYWEAHAKLKCKDLSCNDGYIERKWADELARRKAHNSAVRAAQDARTVTVKLIDSLGAAHEMLLDVASVQK